MKSVKENVRYCLNYSGTRVTQFPDDFHLNFISVSDLHGKCLNGNHTILSFVLLQLTKAFEKCKKECQILFKLFWYKNFAPGKLKLLSFLMVSILISFQCLTYRKCLNGNMRNSMVNSFHYWPQCILGPKHKKIQSMWGLKMH